MQVIFAAILLANLIYAIHPLKKLGTVILLNVESSVRIVFLNLIIQLWKMDLT